VTRFLWCRQQLERDGASNHGTIALAAPLGLQADPPPDRTFEELFRSHYPTLRGFLDGRREPGLALLVASAEGVEASGWFAAKGTVVNTLIVGRHSSADIFLPSDPWLSLRHLALVLHRCGDAGGAGFRVLSLRTPVPMVDEEGTPLEALEARGPVLVRCASLALLLVPTSGAAPDWPEDPDAAWSRIPPRVYIERMPAGSRPGPAPGVAKWAAPAGVDLGAITLASTFPGPVFPSLSFSGAEPAQGELVVSSPFGRVAVRLDAVAARRGVLLGRYERCDTTGLPVLSDAALSRVHLLVLELDGALYAIDTASRNGTWRGPERVRAVRIQPGVRLSLAGRAVVEWRPFH
jgi:hypothetical protein